MPTKIVKAQLNYLRIAPRKVRLVADLVRGRYVNDAINQLRFLNKRASIPLIKLFNSAVSNAWHNFKIAPDHLFISKLTVDEGPKLKRWMPRAFGRATEIQKKTSHITVWLEERISKKKLKIKAAEFKKAEEKKIETEEFVKDRDIKKEETKARPQKFINKFSPKNIITFGRKFFRRKSV